LRNVPHPDRAPSRLKTPRTAALAGILFSVLLISAILLVLRTLRLHPGDPGDWLEAQTWKVELALHLLPFASIVADHPTSIDALKVAGVFLLTASTILLRTGITTRWTAFLGYAAAAFILIASHVVDWTFMIFPVWVLIVSADVLAREYGHAGAPE
jgi:hypothetical protein